MLILALAIASVLFASLAKGSDNSSCSMFCTDFDAHITTENGQGTLMVDGLDVKKLLAEVMTVKAQVTEALGLIGSLQGTVQAQQVSFSNPHLAICLTRLADSH